MEYNHYLYLNRIRAAPEPGSGSGSVTEPKVKYMTEPVTSINF